MTGNRHQKGFTVSELLVVMAIIGILSLVIIPSYKSAKDQLALERSAVQLAQYIAKAREMAMSTQECALCGGVIPSGGYGIYMKETPVVQRTYILFADMNDDQKYNSSQDVQIEEITLENNVGIYSLNKNILNIGFKAPDPMVGLCGKNIGDASFTNFSEIYITIAINDDPDNPTNQKIVRLNATGLISID